jgi:hypothetical protein
VYISSFNTLAKKIPMKKQIIRLISALSMMLAVSLFIPSCKDKCKDVSCLNGGTCEDGDCKCPASATGADCGTCATGYWGTNCSMSCANCSSYTGNYQTFAGNCTTGSPFNQAVTASTSASDMITISNFNNENGWNVNATLTSATALTIASQNNPSNTFKVSGTGTKSNNTVTLDLTFTNLSTQASYSCAATMNKQ